MTTKLYLDTRSIKQGGTAPVKVAMCHGGKTAYFSTNVSVLPSQWDAKHQCVVGHKLKAQLNSLLARKKVDIDMLIYDMQMKGLLHGKSVPAIKEMVEERMLPAEGALFFPFMKKIIEARKKPEVRREMMCVYRRILSYDDRETSLKFNDMDTKWMLGLVSFLQDSNISPNYILHIVGRIKLVFNTAMDDGVCDSIPFRRITLKKNPTKDRSLSVETVRKLFTITPANEGQAIALDFFRLSFCLCGINFKDIYEMPVPEGSVLKFNRSKTGVFTSFSIPKEAQEIIDRRKGNGKMFYMRQDKLSLDSVRMTLNNNLLRVGMERNKGKKGVSGTPLVPGLTTYYARYSWATIAAELDIPKETIGAALAHSEGSITDVYIRTDYRKKIDKANRKVLDYVLYGIRDTE